MQYVEKLFISLEPLYSQSWFPMALGILGLIFAYSVLKTLRSLPKLVMYPIVIATSFIVFFSWVYNRNEPEAISPFIDFLAQWLPARDA
tara:strand:+ start:446 stop:712 length:267 start_codon:yes stop_codon:yes gene_type:complete